MKTVGEILRQSPVWVHPTQGVETAIGLMRDHHLSGLPVLDGIKLVGMAHYKNLLGVDGQHRISEIMEPVTHAVAPSLSVRDAANILMNEHLEVLPVVRDGAVLGVLTAGDLLAELRDPKDPLTDLPWSDSLREWGIQALRSGMEITILFIDVNNFGQFNKQYGHVVGDAVLRRIAGVLRDLDDPERDIVCRYGGDEFCIATLYSAESAARLGEKIIQEVAKISLPEMQGERISVTVGQYGGKRTREREHTHYAATLNNLINLASRDCIRSKPRAAENSNENSVTPSGGSAASLLVNAALIEIPSARIEAETASESAIISLPKEWVSFGTDRIRIRALDVGWSQNIACARVELERIRPDEGQLAERITGYGEVTSETRQASTRKIVVTYAGALTQPVDRSGLPHLVAEATAAALECAFPQEYRLRVEDVFIVKTTETRRLITIVGRAASAAKTVPFAGTAFAGQDIYSAVAQSTLKAISLLPAEISPCHQEQAVNSEL